MPSSKDPPRGDDGKRDRAAKKSPMRGGRTARSGAGGPDSASRKSPMRGGKRSHAKSPIRGGRKKDHPPSNIRGGRLRDSAISTLSADVSVGSRSAEQTRKARPKLSGVANAASAATLLAAKQKRKREAKEARERQRELIELEATRNANIGCCHRFLRGLVGFIHMIDFVGGLALLGYGFAVWARPKAPGLAVGVLVGWGTLLALGSALGIGGFEKPWCGRCGLVCSAFLGPLIAVCDIAFVFSALLNTDEFKSYLERHADALYMKTNTVKNLEKALPFFGFMFIFFAVCEILRFFMLRKLRIDLLRYDDAKAQAKEAARAREGGRGWGWFGRGRVADLEEPLLVPEDTDRKKKKKKEGGGTGVGLSSDPAWMDEEAGLEYEESDEERGFSDEDAGAEPKKGGKWFKKYFGGKKTKETQTREKGKGDDDFAPVNEEPLSWARGLEGTNPERGKSEVDLSWIDDLRPPKKEARPGRPRMDF